MGRLRQTGGSEAYQFDAHAQRGCNEREYELSMAYAIWRIAHILTTHSMTTSARQARRLSCSFGGRGTGSHVGGSLIADGPTAFQRRPFALLCPSAIDGELLAVREHRCVQNPLPYNEAVRRKNYARKRNHPKSVRPSPTSQSWSTQASVSIYVGQSRIFMAHYPDHIRPGSTQREGLREQSACMCQRRDPAAENQPRCKNFRVD